MWCPMKSDTLMAIMAFLSQLELHYDRFYIVVDFLHSFVDISLSTIMDVWFDSTLVVHICRGVQLDDWNVTSQVWGRHGGNGRGDLLHIITHIDTLDQIWKMTHEFPNFDIKSNVDINTIEASAGRVTKGTITAAQKKSRKKSICKSSLLWCALYRNIYMFGIWKKRRISD